MLPGLEVQAIQMFHAAPALVQDNNKNSHISPVKGNHHVNEIGKQHSHGSTNSSECQWNSNFLADGSRTKRSVCDEGPLPGRRYSERHKRETPNPIPMKKMSDKLREILKINPIEGRMRKPMRKNWPVKKLDGKIKIEGSNKIKVQNLVNQFYR